MASRQPMSTAPTDGRKVTVYWTDENGVQNESIGQYRSAERLRTIGDADETDAGWWTFTDSSTQKKIEPQGWKPLGDNDNDD